MKKSKVASADSPSGIGLRFKSAEQRELITRAAYESDTSMNSFIRQAAEKAARALLAASESYKDHSHAQD